MNNAMSWIRLLLVYIVVLFGLLITVEIGLRVAWTVYVCFSKECDFTRMSNLKIYDEDIFDKYIGISRYHDLLGYMPNEGFSSLINAQGWKNKQVTIDQNGFRTNGNKSNTLNKNNLILTVGDAFTFGDQVNDKETWPACIELKTKHKTLNAGVFGYGSAQSVRRASLIMQQQDVNTVILSILIFGDFHRDKLKFRSGYPRPAIIKNNEGEILYADVPPLKSNGTKWHPDYSKSKSIINNFSNHSYLLKKITKILGVSLIGTRRTEIHENAASLGEVIKFTLKEFSNLDAKNKFIVLQYRQKDFPKLHPEVVKTREKLLTEAQSKEIPVIDTYNRLQIELLNKSNSIWIGHHTAYGNAIVCDEIYKFIQKYH